MQTVTVLFISHTFQPFGMTEGLQQSVAIRRMTGNYVIVIISILIVTHHFLFRQLLFHRRTAPIRDQGLTFVEFQFWHRDWEYFWVVSTRRLRPRSFLRVSTSRSRLRLFLSSLDIETETKIVFSLKIETEFVQLIRPWPNEIVPLQNNDRTKLSADI